MITTREAINFQFSLIFGYASPKEDDLIVGDVISPGKLTKDNVRELVVDVLKFLRMYNAIIRDYAGSEVFSIEFELYNFDEKDASIKIYPKSMILIPGKYKDCESLLLALKPETGYMDMHSSRKSVNKISKLFFEVEEFTEHPGLEKGGRENSQPAMREIIEKIVTLNGLIFAFLVVGIIMYLSFWFSKIFCANGSRGWPLPS